MSVSRYAVALLVTAIGIRTSYNDAMIDRYVLRFKCSMNKNRNPINDKRNEPRNRLTDEDDLVTVNKGCTS
jgi:hypothetical protein